MGRVPEGPPHLPTLAASPSPPMPPSSSRPAPPSAGRNWSDLPHDALVSVLHRLIPSPLPDAGVFTLADFSAAAAALAPFAPVSRAWRAAARAAVAELAAALPPLLWEGPPYYRSVHGYSIFYCPVERRPYRKPMPAALSRLAICVGFSQGYLIATEGVPMEAAEAAGTGFALAVVNPFTGDAICGLPELPQQCLRSPSAAALSAPPDSPGCVLVAFEAGKVFHSRVSDPAWATETAPAGIRCVCSAATCGRRVYALTSNWKLLVMEFPSSSPHRIKMALLEPGGALRPGAAELGGALRPRAAVSLADSGDGELLAVKAVGCDSFFWATGKFVVYRMDFAAGNWVTLQGLGSRALFVDCYGHVVFAEPGRWGGQRNCVYFTSVLRRAVGVFNMEDGSVKYMQSNMRFYRATDMWILPGMCS